ncbi:MAG: DUF364 domain-containing protein [Candidatus Sumerlaeaceae bacterium]|nr:DUF364 domain-containing protein [Candidatus Sumerlaeaceae bacterium]
MWELYDELIESVPADLAVEECVAGLHWTLVRSAGTGAAMTPPFAHGMSVTAAGRLVGLPVRDLAARIKSWNPLDAALGLAAINSYVNTEAQLARAFGPQPGRHTANIFDALRGQLRGRRVGIVGHFRGVESLREMCDLTIFELAPQEGDLPAVACEYLLPSMEYVFLTGTTLLNKTLPRLLELCRGARVAIAGPSTPMSPVLLARGAEWVAGTVILDPQVVFRQIREGGGHHDFAGSETQMRLYARGDALAGARGVTG